MYISYLQCTHNRSYRHASIALNMYGLVATSVENVT